MGLFDFRRKKEISESADGRDGKSAADAASDEPVRQEMTPKEAMRNGRVPTSEERKERSRHIAIGAAVLLSAVLIAGPFVINEKAVRDASYARTEVPAAPKDGASAAVPEPPAQSQASGGFTASPASATVPAAPVSAAPASKNLTESAVSQEKQAADLAAKARAKAVAEQNARAKAEMDKKAAAAKKASEDHLARAIQAESAKKAASAVSGAETWTIPVGAFSDASAASKIVANAKANGVSLSSSIVNSEKGKLTRVYAGPFKTRAQAESVEARLAMAGIRTGGIRKTK